MRIAIALLLLGGVAHASGPDLFGLGPRPTALAGAGAADGDGWDEVYTNPAGLADAKRRRLTIGYLGARYSLSLDGSPRSLTNTDGILLGAVLPIPFGGVLRDRVVLGLGFYFPTNLVTRARAPYPDTPRLPLLDDRTQVVSVIVSAGFHLHRRVDFGVGVLALAALVGEIIISTDASGAATTLSNQELVTRLSPIVGLRLRVTDWLRLGLVYRAESKAEYDVQIVSNLGASIPLMIPTLSITGVAQYDPHQLHLEAAFRVACATIFAGVGWKHFSDYPLPVENPTTGTPAQPAPGFHDTIVPRVAAELTRDLSHGLSVIGRLGYAYELSPADAKTTSVYVDADRHVLGGGVGLGWKRGTAGLHLDVFGQWQRLARALRTTGDIGVFGASLGIDL